VTLFKDNILSRVDRVDGELLSLVGKYGSRGHSYNIQGLSFKTEMHGTFFSQRVLNL